jgi:energy-coupling factor transport system ATP-binding protein
LLLQRPESTFVTERVIDEVSLSARWNGVPRDHAERAALGALEMVGLDANIGDADPLQLSGGEQRRVALAAVLSTDARMLVLDEPSAGLDSQARREVRAVIQRLHASGRGVVFITHDPHEASALASRLIVMRDGRVAFDGSPAAVLGRPLVAQELGIDVAPEVRTLHEAAAARGIELAAPPARADLVVAELLRVLQQFPLQKSGVGAPADEEPNVERSLESAHRAIAAMPRRIDARARLIATALAIAAAITAGSLAGAALVCVASAIVMLLVRPGRGRIGAIFRPLISLAITLYALQFVFGNEASVALIGTIDVQSPALVVVHRILQVASMLCVTLALTSATPVTDLATAIRSLFGWLRVVRVPVDELAFVTATGMGMLPALGDELDRLRAAQRARGIGARGPLARAHVDSLLLVPLFVVAFRRAHHLAEALTVRGWDSRVHYAPWRSATLRRPDILVLLSAILCIVGAQAL